MKNILRTIAIVLALGAAIQVVAESVTGEKVASRENSDGSSKSDKGTKVDKGDPGI